MNALRPGALGRRLLLLEDDRHSIDDLRDSFSDLGYECEVVLELDTALDILGKRRMALAVVNAKVAGVKDEKLIAELKALAPDMRLIVFNGTKNKARQRKLRRLGVDSYLSASSDLTAVVRSVQRVLQESP